MAADVVRRALASGASDAECTIAEGAEFSANVRMREIEQLKEAGSRAAGLRILVGRKTGASYTSDLSREGIDRMVRSAIELADLTTEDPHAGMPDDEELGAIPGDLGLYSAETEGLEPGVKIDAAKRADGLSIADTRGGWPSHHGISSDHREQRAFVGPDSDANSLMADMTLRPDGSSAIRARSLTSFRPDIGVSGDGTPRSNSKLSHRMEDHGIGSARHHVAHRGLIISRLDGSFTGRSRCRSSTVYGADRGNGRHHAW